MAYFHFLRPWWLLALVPLLGLAVILYQKKSKLLAWDAICDPHLLAHLVKNDKQSSKHAALIFLFLSAVFVIIGTAGPTWTKLPVPTYKSIMPHVLVLDMSDNMLEKDLSPDRLTRAKFKLHDLLTKKNEGQFGLVVFTGEPFVVSPITEDGNTIDSLLSVLTPDIMPVAGRRLNSALAEANKLLQQAGYNRGQILVLTADPPSQEDIDEATALAHSGVDTSIMPMRQPTDLNSLFEKFAQAGDGQVIPYTIASSDLDQWLKQDRRESAYQLSKQDDIPLWKDEGNWFFIPALLLLIPVFRRGWLKRVAA